MKIKAVRSILAGSAVALVISLSVFAQAGEAVYGISDQNNALIKFDSAAPQTILSAFSITGLQPNEQIRGLDFIGSTLYGLGSQSRLYTINPNTGAATQVGTGQFSPLLNGLEFGFNSTGTLLYIASDLGQNMTLTPTGVGTALPNYTAGSSIDAMGYDHITGQFYGISATSHNWLGLNPTTGAVTTIGATGVNFAHHLALDFSSLSDIPYVSATVAGQAQFFSVNKLTGALTLIGNVGPSGQFTAGLDAIAVVPEPNSIALFAVGGLLVGLLFRKK